MSLTAAAAVVVVAAAVDDEDGVQWRQGGGRSARQHSRVTKWGLRIGDDKAAMEIVISSGGWRRQVSAFDIGDG